MAWLFLSPWAQLTGSLLLGVGGASVTSERDVGHFINSSLSAASGQRGCGERELAWINVAAVEEALTREKKRSDAQPMKVTDLRVAYG